MNFTYENYVGEKNYNPFFVWDFDSNTPLKGYREIYRIPACCLQVRPRINGFAVMVEDEENFEQFWFHIDK